MTDTTTQEATFHDLYALVSNRNEVVEYIEKSSGKRLELSYGSLENLEAADGEDAILCDIASLRSGEHTLKSLLDHCLHGAEWGIEDWVDYVSALGVHLDLEWTDDDCDKIDEILRNTRKA